MLFGISVGLAEPNGALNEALAGLLEVEGASVRASPDAESLFASINGFCPDVLVIDMPFEGKDFREFVSARLGRQPALIAMTTDRKLSLRDPGLGGFQKVLLKPFDAADLVLAISNGLGTGAIRASLARINARANYRFTSLLRFDAKDQLTSVWTYDREDPERESFSLDMTVMDSYCRYVRQTRAPFVVEDSWSDERVQDLPKREPLRAYCGVPLKDARGTVIGSLCHYDVEPRKVPDGEFSLLEGEARELESLLAPR
jgi:CheY-like chemotaxis protein